MKGYTEVERCRICGNKALVSILSLGVQALTGVFPRSKGQAVSAGPMELVKCDESQGEDCCGLVQLKQSYNKDEMYGSHYGYRSGLNPSMVDHLCAKVKKILSVVKLDPGDMVIDIGSNDGTLLKAYPPEGALLVGVDPTGLQFKQYYPSRAQLIPDYFSSGVIRRYFGDKKAKVITSIAMFYDLESPMEFMQQAHGILAEDGVWVLEQSYLPTLLEMNAYDTICHEHLEYYRLKQIKWMADRVGFKIIDLELNAVNGGSFSVTMTKTGSPYPERGELIPQWLKKEKGLEVMDPYEAFRKRVFRHREEVLLFFQKVKSEKKKVVGYGASTKGNVILQFCGLTEKEMPFIGEINREKFGCYTPGTWIPIVSEKEARAAHPDYMVVLPWHFKDFILKKEADYLRAGGKLFFPLPRPEIC